LVATTPRSIQASDHAFSTCIHAFTPACLRAEEPVEHPSSAASVLGGVAAAVVLATLLAQRWRVQKSAETEGINCQKAEAAKTTSPFLCFFLHPKRTMIHRSELALLVMGFLKNEREAFPETLKCFLREAGDLGESSRRAWQLLVSTAALYAAETALALLGC